MPTIVLNPAIGYNVGVTGKNCFAIAFVGLDGGGGGDDRFMQGWGV